GPDLQLIAGRLGAGDVHPRRQAGHGNRAAAPGDRDVIVAVGAVDDDGVGLAVPGATAGGRGEGEVDGGDAGAGQVVDRDRVGAAQGVDVDGLDAGGVHGDGADVAGQPQVAAVGRQVDLLGDGGTVEDHRVLTVPAIDGVAAVAGVPHERV